MIEHARTLPAPLDRCLAIVRRAANVVGLALALLSAGMFAVVAQKQPAVTEEELASIGDAVAMVYQWKNQYQQTVDGLIEASREMPRFWSGTDNAGSEEERVAMVGEILMEERDAVILSAQNRVLDAFEPYDLIEHLERMVAGQVADGDAQIRDTIYAGYRDTIFDAIVRASVEAQRRVDGE